MVAAAIPASAAAHRSEHCHQERPAAIATQAPAFPAAGLRLCLRRASRDCPAAQKPHRPPPARSRLVLVAGIRVAHACDGRSAAATQSTMLRYVALTQLA